MYLLLCYLSSDPLDFHSLDLVVLDTKIQIFKLTLKFGPDLNELSSVLLQNKANFSHVPTNFMVCVYPLHANCRILDCKLVWGNETRKSYILCQCSLHEASALLNKNGQQLRLLKKQQNTGCFQLSLSLNDCVNGGNNVFARCNKKQ